MSKDERHILEGIAVDMVALSMEYIGTPEAAIWEEVRELTDAELIDYVTQ